jgi:hypothetical protein
MLPSSYTGQSHTMNRAVRQLSIAMHCCCHLLQLAASVSMSHGTSPLIHELAICPVIIRQLALPVLPPANNTDNTAIGCKTFSSPIWVRGSEERGAKQYENIITGIQEATRGMSKACNQHTGISLQQEATTRSVGTGAARCSACKKYKHTEACGHGSAIELQTCITCKCSAEH